MSVKLVWATPDVDAMIADMARVSAPENQGKDATRLIGYLIKNKHWSPFEMANMCVEVDTTRDIARQILRHPTLRPQEFSQRYADVRKLGDPVFREARMQDLQNRQNSLPCEDSEVAEWWLQAQADIWNHVSGIYDEALRRGIAKEVARTPLPEGMTPTRLYLNSPIRNWLFYCALRMGHGTQKEGIQIAKEAFEILRQVAPVTVGAFEKERGEP